VPGGAQRGVRVVRSVRDRGVDRYLSIDASFPHHCTFPNAPGATTAPVAGALTCGHQPQAQGRRLIPLNMYLGFVDQGFRADLPLCQAFPVCQFSPFHASSHAPASQPRHERKTGVARAAAALASRAAAVRAGRTRPVVHRPPAATNCPCMAISLSDRRPSSRTTDSRRTRILPEDVRTRDYPRVVIGGPKEGGALSTVGEEPRAGSAII
jgi:hypothetical protein